MSDVVGGTSFRFQRTTCPSGRYLWSTVAGGDSIVARLSFYSRLTLDNVSAPTKSLCLVFREQLHRHEHMLHRLVELVSWSKRAACGLVLTSEAARSDPQLSVMRYIGG